MKQDRIKIGSRESKLAVLQAKMLQACLKEKQIETELITMKTTGDIILDRTLDKIGGKGLFVKELDAALLDGRTDLSVHSLKDVPMELSEELPLLGFSKREDPRDVLVLPLGKTTLEESLPIGCSSRRRALQLQKLFPGVEIKSIRGNVQTRLSKLDSGEYGALVLAAAGLLRLGLADRISRFFSVEEMLPSAGQGILAVQGRKDFNAALLQPFFEKEATYAALCERAFVRYTGGGCSSPIAAHARVFSEKILLKGLYFEEKTGYYEFGEMEGLVEEAEQIGIQLAKKLMSK